MVHVGSRPAFALGRRHYTGHSPRHPLAWLHCRISEDGEAAPLTGGHPAPQPTAGLLPY